MATTESHAMSRPRAALAERATRIRGGRESPFFQLLKLAEARGDVITLGRGVVSTAQYPDTYCDVTR